MKKSKLFYYTLNFQQELIQFLVQIKPQNLQVRMLMVQHTCLKLFRYVNIKRTEVTHILDNNSGLRKFKISNSKEWKEACELDGLQNYEIDPVSGEKISTNFVSDYSGDVNQKEKVSKKIKQAEDFAESVMRYLDPEDKNFVNEFPNRAKFIKDLLGVEPGENQTYWG